MDGTKKTALEDAVAAMETLKESYPEGRINRDDTSKWVEGSFVLSPWMAYDNFTDEERTAIWDAMEDEIVYQYMHEGYDLGFLTANPNRVQEQEGLLYVEVGDGGDGGDNIAGCNPWGQAGRLWAAVVAPYEGVAFSIKSPFGYLGVGNLLLLGNAFEYEGRVYLLTETGVHSYDASLGTVTADDMDTEAIFPGSGEVGEGEEVEILDITNGTFAYAAALYNQAEKWNGKTVGIPSGDTVLTEDGYTYYQAFEGPDGVMYIVGDASAIGDADPDVPAKVAFVLDAEDQAALLAATKAADVAAALAQTGAPVMARSESGNWEFAKGYIADGSFTAYSAAELVERKIAAIPAIPEGGIADQATYDAIEAAYLDALNAYNELLPEDQEDVENKDILNACKAALEAYDAAVKAAAEVDKMLNALPYDVDKVVEDTTTDFAGQIQEAENAYNALTEAAKSLVKNYGYLQDAKDTMAAAAVVTEYYQKVPADYQEVWGAKYKDEASYLEGAEYAQYVKPLEDAVDALTEDALGALEGSDYWLDIRDVIDWRPEENPEPEDYTIEDVMKACRVLARKNTGQQAPQPDELERYDLTEDGDIGIDDIMAICRQIAIKNQQQGA